MADPTRDSGTTGGGPDAVPDGRGPAAAADELRRLAEVVDALLAEDGGCAWNRAQTHESLVTYLVEEVSELVEALEAGSPTDVREELGDVLYQVVLHAGVAARRADAGFDLADVVRDVREKTVRRHPHVFGDDRVDDLDGIVEVWSAAKAREKAARTSRYDGVATTMPALARAQKLTSRGRPEGALAGSVDEVGGDGARGPEERVGQAGPGRLADARDEAEWGRRLLVEVDAVEGRGFDVERALRTAVREREQRWREEERRRRDVERDRSRGEAG